MQNTPQSLHLQIVLAGAVNSGKSTLLNKLSGQDISITSPLPGTTTDVVRKAMELRPLGPVLFLDTAGLDDTTELGTARSGRSIKTLDRADILLLVTVAGKWGKSEEELLALAEERKIPVIPVVNKCDEKIPDADFTALIKEKCGNEPLIVSALTTAREDILQQLTPLLLSVVPEEFVTPPPMVGDLVAPGGTVVMIVPIDIQAPKGRLILPQVQALREILDSNCTAVVCKTSDYKATLDNMKNPPALVICDSQVVDVMVRETPLGIPCTTFSILLSRIKGDLELFSKGAQTICQLHPGDKVLIAEGCTHHAADDDIGRVKIPNMLEKKVQGKLEFTICSGHDFPENLSEFKLVLHCGGCMLNRREVLRRLQLASAAGVPVVNYGMAISFCKGVLQRVLEPFA
ncbi:MAG: [FeFe] hydrogenase H-cluster maturation GTPase HydF [Lentisphaerae bacterium]|nr:[FeFe] hydrogenase H-cluster maturation GTPase HydF [Lentisphaerota bacterium]MBR2873982.1 [FeFe] hydrogenase H-cluster maturation GTPase HydF [Lentisphaeria bacterium]